MTSLYSDLLRESKLHGSYDYPIEHYVCKIPYTYHFLPAHWHEEFEITLVVSGKLSYTIGNESFTVSEGQLLFVPPNSLHSASQLDQYEAETYTIVFHLNLLGLGQNDRCSKQFIDPLQSGKFLPISVLKPGEAMYDQLRSCFDLLWEYQRTADGTELLVKSQLFQLIHLLRSISIHAGESESAPDALRNAEKIKPVLSYIRLHYAEQMTIEELAAVCGFSAVHFMNIFKKVVGSSCIEYIIEYRVSMSTAALKDTDAPILKIAMDHGFQNISYYNRTFRRKLGMTPSQYRKIYRS